MKRFKAIAAMSENRVIGRNNQIPWHLPADFKWFRQTTTGHILVMGRKTFESIGKPLPNRTTYVLSRRDISIPGVTVIRSFDELPTNDPRDIFICGGAEIYGQALPHCSDLYLTLVKRHIPDGDAFFPTFEDQFALAEEVMDCPEFKILHYRNKAA